MKNINNRTTEYDVNDIFLNRYSSRAMSGEVVSSDEVMTLLESARWAPSSMNEQPWRFLYAVRGTKDFDLFLSFLFDRNKSWSQNAGSIIIELSKKNSEGGDLNIKNSFDAGAAWENIALQGAFMNLVIHPIGGFDEDVLIKELNISDEYKVEVMIVVGKPGKIENLPEVLQEREKPSQRKTLGEIAFEGKEGVKML